MWSTLILHHHSAFLLVFCVWGPDTQRDTQQATISSHGSSARRASTSSAAGARDEPGARRSVTSPSAEARAPAAPGAAKGVMKRSPSKKHDVSDDATFNPLVAMQTVVAGDLVPIKQRSKAAQQLATYLCELPTTPSLYAYYEPYLPIVASVVVAPIKATKEVQENAVKMLKALASHSPRQFVEWCALHASMSVAPDAWHVDWCCGLLLAAETRIPRTGGDDFSVWDTHSMEYQEVDAAAAAVIHLWRSILDTADDEAVVYEIAVGMRTLLCYQPTASEQLWRALVMSKIQPHFVDMADVLIGWTMSVTTSKRLRESIIILLEEMRELWLGNGVFCLQLLESFAGDVGSIYTSPTSTTDDFGRLDPIILCSTLVAQWLPLKSLGSQNGQLGFVEKLLRSTDSSSFTYSSTTLVRLSEYFDSISAAHFERFAPLVMRAIRFLLRQLAAQISTRRCDMHSALCVLEKANRLAKMLSVDLADLDARRQAKFLLTDKVKDDSSDKIESEVFDTLLQLRYFAAVKYTTQIAIQIAVYMGIEGLQVLAGVIDHKMKASHDSPLSFWVTCFILASKCAQMSRLIYDATVCMKAIDSIVSIIRQAKAKVKTSAQDVVTVLKLSMSFITVVKQVRNEEITGSLSNLVVENLRLGVQVMESHESASSLDRDTLCSLAHFISNNPPSCLIPADVQESIVAQLRRVSSQSEVSLTEEIIRVLVQLAPLVSSRSACVAVYHLATELLDEADESTRLTLTSQVIPTLKFAALLSDKVSQLEPDASTSWKSIWVPSEMSVGDFEQVYDLLGSPESTYDSWCRLSRRVHARMRRNLYRASFDRPLMLKTTVREAAKWIVQNRLRSPLGPPSAVFSGIEKMLLSHVHRHQAVRNRGPSGSIVRVNVSATLLVEFVLAMEMLFGIATDFKSHEVNTDAEIQKIYSFFRANVAVCEEWLYRIRPSLTELSASLRQSESLMHQNIAVISVLTRKVEGAMAIPLSASLEDEASRRLAKCAIDLEEAVFNVAESLCQLADSDSIGGLRVWWNDLLVRVARCLSPSSPDWQQHMMLASANSEWINAIALEAEQRHEEAIVAYEYVIGRAMSTRPHENVQPEFATHPLLSPLGASLGVVVGCLRRCGQCYARLQRWDDLRGLSFRCQQFLFGVREWIGSISPFSKLVELCESWRVEDPVVLVLATFDHTSFSDALSIDREAAMRASRTVQKWGALSALDRSSAKAFLRAGQGAELSDISYVAESLEYLRFRPHQAFADTLSPSTLKERELSLLLASLLADSVSREADWGTQLQHSVSADLLAASVDPALWSRLNLPYLDRETEAKWWLAIVRHSRKRNNVVFAESALKKLRSHVDPTLTETPQLAVLYEEAVLRMAGETSSEGVATLVRLCDSVLRSTSGTPRSHLSESVHMRVLLKLARTLAGVDTGEEFPAVEAAMKVIGSQIDRSGAKGLVDYRDQLVMTCLESATQIAPSNPRAWYHFGKWCHQQGRQRLDALCVNGGVLDLQVDEQTQLAHLVDELRASGSTADEAEISAAFLRVMDGGSLVSNRDERLRQVLSTAISASEHKDLLDRFSALQGQVVSRLLNPIRNAAIGYRSFLQSAGSQSAKETSKRDNSRITSVALRLLRMLTRFGSERSIADVVTDVFISGSLSPWGRIVPQLLSRIGHSYTGISTPVASLLKRLARRYPHLVVYPAIVEAGRREEGEMAGRSLLAEVVAELRGCASELAEGVSRMVGELKRISILWDDAWIWALIKMSGDVNRRISTLEREAQRVEKNSTLSADEKLQLARRKAVAIMTPVLVAVERLWMDTLGKAAPGSVLTPHEKQFANKYGSAISKGIQVFRGYCGGGNAVVGVETISAISDTPEGVLSPSEVWRPFAELLKSLMAAVGRRERVDLAEISPILARTSHKSKAALMPGTFSTDNFDVDSVHLPTISDISRNVVILRTKTKPKCLKFVGSDGKVHRYLLKAREDLHLDERIMQFLDTVNEFLRADPASSDRNLRARNYSVVPVSNDAGLIQMVPEVLPLFQIYTNRVEGSADGVSLVGPAAAGAAAADCEQSSLPLQQPPTAPFYAKLKHYGVQDVSPAQRSRWPVSVLRRVQEDLVSSRPPNVIHRELVAQSTDFADVWAKKYRFSRSTAVMSVLGYLVGLGDRHLDNMLLCTTTGELLHIDYNVCFDKGRKLKVPEIVPFRLTPIIVDGLGLTGVDGIFRSAFMNTLRVVRDPDSREALLALLDAFVYDPLVDWVANAKHRTISRDTKQRMDVNVNLSLFLSRARERSQDTTRFVKQFETTSRQVETTLEKLAEFFGSDTIYQCRVYVKAIEAKKVTDKLLQETQLKWNEQVALRQQENNDEGKLRESIDATVTAITAFGKECTGRHKHICQVWDRLANFCPATASGFASQVSLPNELSRAHNRIIGIATQLPLSPSTPVWNSMLANLEPKCQSLDQQIPAILEHCNLVIKAFGPVLELYKIRQTTQRPVVDVYETWSGWCTNLLALINSGQLPTARDFIRDVFTRIDASSSEMCKRTHHEKRIAHLRIHVQRSQERTSADSKGDEAECGIENRVQQFLGSFSSLKLSNSQTQRVIKLINTRWLISAIDRLQTADSSLCGRGLRAQPSIQVLHSVAHVTFILRYLASSPKGAMRKILLDMTASGTNIQVNERDTTECTLNGFVSLLASLESLESCCFNELATVSEEGSVTQNLIADSLAVVADRANALTEAYTTNGLSEGLINVLPGVKSLELGVLSAVNASLGRLHSTDITAVEETITTLILEFVADSLNPVLVGLVRRVVCGEWNIDENVLTLGVNHVDTLALEAMPAISSSSSPVSEFQSASSHFMSIWSFWEAVSTDAAIVEESDHRVLILKKAVDVHQRHLDFLDWIEGQDSTARAELSRQVATLAPSLPLLYEDMARVESNLLEVAQQLEYLASQISFSCAMGFSSSEVELRSICREVQNLYSQTTRHFDATRSVSDLAAGINLVESSLFKLCQGMLTNTEFPGQSEANQVGRNLFDTAEIHLQSRVEMGHRGEDPLTISLNRQLEDARLAVVEADRNVMERQEAFASLCGSIQQSQAFSSIQSAVQQVNSQLELMRSLGLQSAREEKDPIGQRRSPSARKVADQGTFSLAENERLVRILHRSVESIASMNALSAVLADHDQHHQELITAATRIEDVLGSFSTSARAAVESQNIALCIRALEEVLDVASSGLLTTAAAKLETCCHRFFEAAELADELTKAEDRATILGENGGVGDGEDHAVELGEEGIDGHGADDHLDLQDDENPLSVPLRPIAGFQEQNQYGVDVVSRIDDKLGGVIVESGSREALPIEDQSSWLIRAATNVDNLCVMYEGWTPWI